MFKYSLLPIAILLLATVDADAQRRARVGTSSVAPAPELFIFGGYVLNGGTDAILNGQPGRINVTDGPTFGGSIAVPARPGTNVELTYWYHDSGYLFEPNIGFPTDEEGMTIHYIQIGGQQYIPNGNVHPYGSFTVGAAVFGDNWEFAFTGGLGVKNYINEKLALRIDARLMLPIFWGGVGFYCGLGGCAPSAGGTVGMWSGAFTGGLVYRLGQ